MAQEFLGGRGIGFLGNVAPHLVVWPELVTCCMWIKPLCLSWSGVTSPHRKTGEALSPEAQLVTTADSGPGMWWLDLLTLFPIHSTHVWGPYLVPVTVLGGTAERTKHKAGTRDPQKAQCPG